MIFYYPSFKTKALTFSYDDGTVQDRRLTEIFKKYNLKATFNLNSYTLGEKGFLENHGGFRVNFDKINSEEVISLYDGFEVAGHTTRHYSLPMLNDADFDKAILDDFVMLEKLCKKKPIGLAYPCGVYDERTTNRLKSLGVRFARTVKDTLRFEIPENFLSWHPTCHDHAPQIDTLINDFLSDNAPHLALFYIWGHAFELDKTDSDRWDDMENICKSLSNKNDVWYATNGEICEYITALRSFEATGCKKNNTEHNLYIEFDGKRIVLAPDETP